MKNLSTGKLDEDTGRTQLPAHCTVHLGGCPERRIREACAGGKFRQRAGWHTRSLPIGVQTAPLWQIDVSIVSATEILYLRTSLRAYSTLDYMHERGATSLPYDSPLGSPRAALQSASGEHHQLLTPPRPAYLPSTIPATQASLSLDAMR